MIMKKYDVIHIDLLTATFNYFIYSKNENELLNELNIFDFQAFCKEQQERVDKNLPPTVEIKNLIEAMVEFMEKIGNKAWVDSSDNMINILSNTAIIIKKYIQYYNDKEYFKDEFGRFWKRTNNIEDSKDILDLPTPLNTDRARKYFAKAEEMGYLERTDTGYKSNFKTKVLLAYFLELVFCRDDNNKYNGQKFPDTALSELFQENRLGKSRGQTSDNKNGDGKPRGYEIVDEIFY